MMWRKLADYASRTKGDKKRRTITSASYNLTGGQSHLLAITLQFIFIWAIPLQFIFIWGNTFQIKKSEMSSIFYISNHNISYMSRFIYSAWRTVMLSYGPSLILIVDAYISNLALRIRSKMSYAIMRLMLSHAIIDKPMSILALWENAVLTSCDDCLSSCHIPYIIKHLLIFAAIEFRHLCCVLHESTRIKKMMHLIPFKIKNILTPREQWYI